MISSKFKPGDLVRTIKDCPGPGQWHADEPLPPVLLLKYWPFRLPGERFSYWDVLVGDNVMEWNSSFVEIFCVKIT